MHKITFSSALSLQILTFCHKRKRRCLRMQISTEPLSLCRYLNGSSAAPKPLLLLKRLIWSCQVIGCSAGWVIPSSTAVRKPHFRRLGRANPVPTNTRHRPSVGSPSATVARHWVDVWCSLGNDLFSAHPIRKIVYVCILYILFHLTIVRGFPGNYCLDILLSCLYIILIFTKKIRITW